MFHRETSGTKRLLAYLNQQPPPTTPTNHPLHASANSCLGFAERRCLPAATDPRNGKVTCYHGGGNDYGSICYYSCNEGYKKSPSTDALVTCGADGEWSRPPYTCRSKINFAVSCWLLQKSSLFGWYNLSQNLVSSINYELVLGCC